MDGRTLLLTALFNICNDTTGRYYYGAWIGIVLCAMIANSKLLVPQSSVCLQRVNPTPPQDYHQGPVVTARTPPALLVIQCNPDLTSAPPSPHQLGPADQWQTHNNHPHSHPDQLGLVDHWKQSEVEGMIHQPATWLLSGFWLRSLAICH